MEKLSYRKSVATTSAALAFTALNSCSFEIDSYLTDPSNVQCDDKRTKSDLEGDGTSSFIVHGDKDKIATVTVRRKDDAVSVAVTGDVTGPPQDLESDGYTEPTPIVEGSELTAFGAGGAWVIDVRKDSVVIQGTCEGM